MSIKSGKILEKLSIFIKTVLKNLNMYGSICICMKMSIKSSQNII